MNKKLIIGDSTFNLNAILELEFNLTSNIIFLESNIFVRRDI